MVLGNILWGYALANNYDEIHQTLDFAFVILIFIVGAAVADVLFIKPKNLKYCYQSVHKSDESKDDDYNRAPDGQIYMQQEPTGVNAYM